MKDITVTLSDETVDKLSAAAQKIGIKPEDLLRVSIEDKLQAIDSDFNNAVTYVLEKNAELYRRLA
ncbi:DNA-binding protein [bacterium]|nr:DNA-binding protein [bacterium]